jgi:hypothetical protein
MEGSGIDEEMCVVSNIYIDKIETGLVKSQLIQF